MRHRALQHRARAFVALLLAALTALTLAACGGGDDEGGSGGGGGGGDSADARTLLRDTFSGTKDVRSGRLGLTLRLAETGGETMAISLSGPFESTGEERYPKFDLDVDAELGAQGDFSAGMVSTSDRLFVEFEGQAFEVPAEYLRQAQGSSSESRLEIPGLDPESWIENPEVVGTEDVGGAETDHIRADMNISAFLDDIDTVLAEIDRQGLSAAAGGGVPTSIPAETRAEIERTIREPTVDVWSGTEDSTLRRLEIDLGVDPEDGRGGTIQFVLEMSDLNESQTIEAPSGARPLEELLGSLGGLGLGGAPGSSGSDLGNTAEWQRCVEDAGADVQAAQRCAELLTR